MWRYYELMYYAIYRQRSEGQTDGFNYASRFYTYLVFMNAAPLLILLNAVLQTWGIVIARSDLYWFIIAIVLGIGMDVLMGRRAERIKAKFEIQDWSNIATWLIVHIIFSFVFFIAIAIRFQYM